MEFLIELVLDLVLEESISLSTNKKVPKLIRYILIGFISLFFLFVIFCILILGIALLKKNTWIGIVIIALGVFLGVECVIKFKNLYDEKMNEKKAA